MVTRFFHSLQNKLIFLFLVTSLIPFLAIGLFIYFYAQHTLEAKVIDELTTVRDIKAHQIETYFAERLKNLTTTANSPLVITAFSAFESTLHATVIAQTVPVSENKIINTLRLAYLNRPNLANSEDGSAYTTIHAHYHPVFKSYLETYGYQDILLVELRKGLVVYSTAKENDFGTSLTNGVYANTHLSKLFQQVIKTTDPNFTTLVDFAYYPPAKKPVAFIGAPIFKQAEMTGLLIFQLSTDQIDEVMQTHIGLGKTGESILIGADDGLLRSSSRPSTKALSVKVGTELSYVATSGKMDVKKALDYRGKPVIVAYTPLNVPKVHWLLTVQINIAEAFLYTKQLSKFITLLILLGIIVVSVIALLVSRFMMHPIREVTKIAHQLTVGDLSPPDLEVKGQDELARMAEAFREMIRNQQKIISDMVRLSQGLTEGHLRVSYIANYQGDLAQIKQAIETALFNLRQQVTDIVKITQALAEGEVTVVPQAQYKGEFIKIKQALTTTTQKLADVTAKNAVQDWLKTGQTQLNEKLRGEQDIITLAKRTIDFLTGYINAEVGLFYLIKETADQPPYLQKVASYAYTQRNSLLDKFHLGEGLVGQAALEKKRIIQTYATHDTIVQSGLVQMTPSYVLFIPFLYEDVVKGVVELGASNPFTDKQKAFLDQAMSSIGIAIHSAEARDRLKTLLQHSQSQAKALETQQATLKQVNEELQVQAEELQTQQEELRQSNEELAVQAKTLVQQKAEIHEKNKSLEVAHQMMEIKAQDLALASQYKSEFLANMSHELRTPLNSLLILAQMLAENKQGNLTDKQLEYANTIHSAGSDLLNLINDILDLSKIEAGKMEIVTETVNLTDLIKTMIQRFQPLAQDKGLPLEYDMVEDISLLTDGQRLKQILGNLLSNALKFTAEGSVKLSVYHPSAEAVAKIGLNANMLVIEVIDTGIGIAKEKQQAIFEAFQQADGTTSRRYGGTGLGLSISRQLANLLGGDLVLASVEGEGSTFSLYIPNNPSDQVPIQQIPPVTSSHDYIAPHQEDEQQHLQPADSSILIIEDDIKLSNILMELAQEKGFKGLRAETGEVGLQLAQQYQPTAIVLDVGLPQMDGWAVLEQLKTDPKTRQIPVHFISATDQVIHAKRMGAIGYSLKPVTIAEVGETFQKITQFITRTTKHVLVVISDDERQQAIQDLLKENETTFVTNTTVAMTSLQEIVFDCIIIDIDAESMTLLEYLKNNKTLAQIPIIVYTTRSLTIEESTALENYAQKLPVKTVQSYERLLDEVTLFLHQITSHPPMVTPLEQAPTEAIFMDKKILIVDDDSRNVFALTVVLDGKGMIVSNCENGQQALALLTKQPDIDIVLMDIMMPNMDGYETIRKIREQAHFQQLPIIALTAKAMKGDKAKCVEAGANDYLAKPIDTEQLLSLLRVWLYTTKQPANATSNTDLLNGLC